jgi:hypothetical protein
MKPNNIIAIACKEVGYTEQPKNSNLTKYGKWFLFDGVAWCAMFVSWVYHHSGFPLGNIGYLKGFAGCQTGIEHFTKTDEITTEPVSGDIVFFDWKKDNHFDHVGIFNQWVTDTTFETIEGNTSVGNDSNGGQVMDRVRDTSKYTCIFVHPRILD